MSNPSAAWFRVPTFLLAASLLGLSAPGQGGGAADAGKPKAAEPEVEVPPLGKAATETLVHSYGQADTWAMRALVLLSMGRDFHPVGVASVLAALRDKDERLKPHAIELLRRMDDESLRQVATTELVGELIGKQLAHKNALYVERLLEVLGRMLPAAGAKDRKGYEAWWKANEKTWTPPEWVAPPELPAAAKGGTVVGAVVQRAFDLRDAGLDVAIVIDSTGSMQMAIDTARDAIDDVTALLASISPKMRLGLVHYKDFDDFGEGAQQLVAMTKKTKEVKDKLGKLVASGGGDIPERVEKGIEIALGKEMGWNKDANRLILVLGDAPPHEDTMKDLLDMVQRAHDAPFEPIPKGRAPTTGPKKNEFRPFITSTLVAKLDQKIEEARKLAASTTAAFEQIAAAGGGICAGIEPVKKVDGKAVAGQGASAEQQVVEHILLLSFGAQHKAQVRLFAATFFAYREAGLFK